MYLQKLIQNPVTHLRWRLINYSFESDHEYSEHTIAVFSSSKKMVGHISDPLAIKFFFH